MSNGFRAEFLTPECLWCRVELLLWPVVLVVQGFPVHGIRDSKVLGLSVCYVWLVVTRVWCLWSCNTEPRV